jgi:hypothetical protein
MSGTDRNTLARLALVFTLVALAAPAGAHAQLHHFTVESQGGGPVGTRTAGTPFFIQVLAMDSLNSPFSSFSGTVEISSDGPLLTGGGTSAAFGAGILDSHSVNFSIGGVYTLTAANSAGAESGVSDTFTVNNPLPQVHSLLPSSRTAGDTGFTLSVTGADFTPVSAVLFDGVAVPTTFVSDTQVTAFIDAVHIDTAGSFGVAVSSPSPGGGASGQVPFDVLDAALSARVFLEGPYGGAGTMSTQLRADGVVPLSQPFSGAPTNYPGTESVAAVPPGVVDWVLLALRTGTNGATEVARRAAFLMSDGTVADLDGSPGVAFPGTAPGSYYVVVRHRNHVPAMSGSPRPLDAPADSCDFTSGPGAYFGAGAKALAGGAWGLIGGDYSGDGFIDAADFAGPDNEIFLSGYRGSDLNLDGFIDAADFAYPDNNIFTGSSVPN